MFFCLYHSVLIQTISCVLFQRFIKKDAHNFHERYHTKGMEFIIVPDLNLANVGVASQSNIMFSILCPPVLVLN